DGTPSPSPSGAAARPSVGTEGQTRGAGGELRIIQHQAPTTANAHVSVGTKDFLAGALVQEPLMSYLPDGTIIPTLITEVPAVENGLLAEDLSSATFKLMEGVLWSDGQPFTSRDVQFTWQWITNPDNNSVNITTWQAISNVETPDELTAVVTYASPSATWFEPFTGGVNGPIMPAHAFGDDPAAQNTDFITRPIGTGPFVITNFSANDIVQYETNQNYREPNKPFFSSVYIKGGGDAASAARAVLQTGDYAYAWNLQVEPAILEGMVTEGGPGVLVSEVGTSVERIHINFSDPNTEVDGQRSEMNTPHPFLTDLAVRQAMNVAVPRQLITDEFYGLAARTTPNILTGLEAFESPNTSWEFNLEKAAQTLEEAGWTMNGDVRSKEGVDLVVSYGTSINPVRQKTQAVVKQAFESIGIKVNLDQVDAGTFFDSSAGNDRNIGHMYWDITMYTNNPSSPIPAAFMLSWYAGPEGRNIAQESNGWSGQNYQRYNNPEFDALYDSLIKETDIEAAAQTLIQMNDVLINDVVIIPEVNRPSDTYAISSQLNNENVALGVGFELNYWNIANWNNKAS
ncbi:MAG: peptide ABC transporter substrate-binding protein, partial [Chloroflexota bacterium]|nr:peptide ABC transporter substrate-binding protein [Chloroflexota bacterium]